MQTVKSSVLIIGGNPVTSIGVNTVYDLTSARDLMNHNVFDVIVLKLSDLHDSYFESLMKQARQQNSHCQFIFVREQAEYSSRILELVNHYKVYRLLSSFQDESLEFHLIDALENANLLKQNDQLDHLYREHTDQLNSLKIELEDRIKKRQKFLIDARRKLFITNERTDSLRRTLLSIYKAKSIGELEMSLHESLAPSLHLTWTRIFFKPQDELFLKQTHDVLPSSVFKSEIFRGNEVIGSIFFLRPETLPFLKEETNFLKKISEAASIAIDRIQTLEQVELVKTQWEATFNAISDPLILIDSEYNIIQSNSAFVDQAKNKDGARSEVTAESLSDAQKRHELKCYQALFKRDTPCTHCKLGESFHMDGFKKNQTLEVASHRIAGQTYVNLYKDVSEQLRIENQILESAKLAELGSIGSSIAHELNNPLGGILSLVQIIKSEMTSSDIHYADIVEMENGVLRSKEIVQNLLGFSRNTDQDIERDVDLREVVSRALKIVELKTKSQGIDVRIFVPDEPCMVRGHLNMLAQAVQNILQNSISSILNKSQTSPSKGLIEVHLIKQSDLNSFEMQIIDNGPGPEIAGLGLSVAQQIIADHGGTMELFAQSKPVRKARISLPGLVFRP